MNRHDSDGPSDREVDLTPVDDVVDNPVVAGIAFGCHPVNLHSCRDLITDVGIDDSLPGQPHGILIGQCHDAHVVAPPYTSRWSDPIIPNPITPTFNMVSLPACLVRRALESP